MKALDEIKEVFDKYNITIALVYCNGDMNNPQLELTYEEDGQYVYLDHYWEGRIKAYNLIPTREGK